MKKATAEENIIKTKIIRQDRHEIQDIRCQLQLNEDHVSMSVINYSSFGIAVESEHRFDTTKIFEGSLSIEGNSICNIKFKAVRHEKFDNNKIRVAFELLEGTIPVEKINIYSETIKLTNSLATSMEHYKSIPSDFKKEVYELKNRLENFQEMINTIDSGKKFFSLNEKEDFEVTVIDAVSPSIHDSIRITNLTLSEIIEKLPKDLQNLCFDFFRHQLRSFIYQSPFAHRSFTKPLGYAGDYEMMNMIYKNQDAGDSLYARCIERAMQMHSEPQAVRNRSEYLKEKILSCAENNMHTNIKILSVACGPAIEVKKVITDLSQEDLENIEFHLLDQDVLALKNAQLNILTEAKRQNKIVKIKLINMPIKQVIIDGLGLNEYDLIYSAGLFDYFTDSVANRAAQVLHAALKDIGKLIIGNFDTNTPNRFGMLTLFDWHLILRSKSDLERIFSFNKTKLTIEAERNGVNLFCIIEK